MPGEINLLDALKRAEAEKAQREFLEQPCPECGGKLDSHAGMRFVCLECGVHHDRWEAEKHLAS